MIVVNQLLTEKSTMQAEAATRFAATDVEIARIVEEAADTAQKKAIAGRKSEAEQKLLSKKAAKEALDAANQERNAIRTANVGIRDRDAEDRGAIKAARNVLVEGLKKSPEYEKLLEKAAKVSSNAVNNAADQASKSLKQLAQRVKDLYLKDGDDLESNLKKKIKDKSNGIRDNSDRIIKNTKERIRISTGDNTVQDDEKMLRELSNFAKTLAERAGGDILAQEIAKARVCAAYSAAQVEIARAAEVAARAAQRAKERADLDIADQNAGRDLRQAIDHAGHDAAKSAIEAAEAARHEAAIQGKDIVEQYAAAAAAATQFSTTQAETTQNVISAYDAALHLAQAEKKSKIQQQIDAQNAAIKVLDAVNGIRVKAANAKITQAQEEVAILARETAIAEGYPKLAPVDGQGNPTGPGQDRNTKEAVQRVKDAAVTARIAALTERRSLAAAEEAAEVAALAQLTIERALRDIAMSIRTVRGPRGENRYASAAELNTEVRNDLGNVLKQINNAKNMGNTLLAKNAKAAEMARYVAKEWQTRANIATDARRIEILIGTAAGNIDNEIKKRLKDIIDSTSAIYVNARDTDKMDILHIQHLTTEASARFAIVQSAELVAALSARETAERRGLPLNAPALSQETEARAAVTRIRNGIIAIPAGLDAKLQPNKQAEIAIELAEAESELAKATKAAGKYAETAAQLAGYAQNPGALGIATQLSEKQAAANRVIEVFNNKLALGTKVALDAAMREVEFYKNLAKIAVKVRGDAFNASNLAGRQNCDQDANTSVANLLVEVNNAYTQAANAVTGGGLGAVGRDPTAEALVVALRAEAAEAQIAEAVERTYNNSSQGIWRTASYFIGVGFFRDTDHEYKVIESKAIINEARTAGNNAAVAGGDRFREAAVAAVQLAEIKVRENQAKPDVEAAKAIQAIQDAGNTVSKILDGTKAVARETEVTRILDSAVFVTRNPEVAQAMADAATAAATAEELKQVIADIANQAEVSVKAARDVKQTSVAAFFAGKAVNMDENKLNAEISKAAYSAAARYIAKHAVAISAYQTMEKQTGNIPNARGAAINVLEKLDARQWERGVAIRQEVARMAGLIINVDETLSIDPAAAQYSTINEAKEASKNTLVILGVEDANKLDNEAEGVQQRLVAAANRARQAVEIAGGDSVEQTLAAATAIERLTATIKAVRDVAEAVRETEKAIGGNEKDMDAVANKAVKLVKKVITEVREAAARAGMDEDAQDAAGAAAAEQFAATEKAVRDAALAARETAEAKSDNVNEHIAAAKDAVKTVRDTVKAAQDAEIEKAAALAATDFIEKCISTAQTDAEQALPATATPDQKEKAEKEAEKIVRNAANNAIQTTKKEKKDTIVQYASAASAAKRVVLVEKSIMTAQSDAEAALGQTATQAEKDDARKKAANTIRNAVDQAQMQAVLKGKSLIEQNEIVAMAARSAVQIEKSIIKAQEYAVANLGGGPPAPTQLQVEAAKATAEKNIRDAVNAALMQAPQDDLIAQYIAAAVAAAQKAFEGNAILMQNMINEARQDVETAATTVQDVATTVQDASVATQNAAAAAVSAATAARITEVQQAIRYLDPEAAKKVIDAAADAHIQANRDGKDLIAQQAEATAAAKRQASKIAEESAEAQEAAANEGRQVVEAAVIATQDASAKASRGTAIQAEITNKVARYAAARAEIAQAIQVVTAHVQRLVDDSLNLTPPDGQPFNPVPGIPRNGEGNGAAYRARVTQSIAKQMVHLVAATQAAAPAGTDPVIAWEQAAAAATAYAVELDRDTNGVLTRDAIKRNATATTEAVGVAGIAKRYAARVADKDAAIKALAVKNVSVLKSAHASSEAFAIFDKEEIAQAFAMMELQVVEETKKEMLGASESAINAKKAAEEEKAEQADAGREAAIQVATARATVAQMVKETSDSIKNSAQVAGLLNPDSLASKNAQKVENDALTKQHEALQELLAEKINKAGGAVEKTATSFAAAFQTANTTVNAVVFKAKDRIMRIATNAKNNAINANKDLVTQYVEAAAVAAAAGELEAAQISVVENLRAAGTDAGNPITPQDETNIKDIVITIAKDARARNAHLGVVQQEVAAAAAVKQHAKNIAQATEAVIALANSGRPNAQNEARQVLDQFSTTKNMILAINGKNLKASIASAASANREKSSILGEHVDQRLKAARSALQASVQAGEEGAKSVRDSANSIRNRANEAYIEGAKQGAKAGIALGQTLEVVAAAPIKEAIEATDKNSDYFVNLVKEIDEQADEEARNQPNSTLDQRIQARILALRQAAVVLPKLAKDIKAAVAASKDLARFAGRDPKAEAIKTGKSILDKFTTKRAAVKSGGGSLSATLTAGGSAAAQTADAIVSLKGEIEVLNNQIEKDVKRFKWPEEQENKIKTEAIRSILDQIDQRRADAKNANRDFTVQDQAAVLREAIPKARTATIPSDDVIDNVVTEVAQELDNTISATVKQRNLNGLQMIEAYEKYAGKTNLTRIEQATLKDILDQASKMHYSYQIELNIRMALAAAQRGQFDTKTVNGQVIRGAYEYLKPENGFKVDGVIDKSSDSFNDKRLATVHDVFDRIKLALADSTVGSRMDERLVPLLVSAKQELDISSNNLRRALEALPEVREKEKKAIEDEILKEDIVPLRRKGSGIGLLDPDQEEEVTVKGGKIKLKGGKVQGGAKNIKLPDTRTEAEKKHDMEKDAMERSKNLQKQALREVTDMINEVNDPEIRQLLLQDIDKRVAESFKVSMDLYKINYAKEEKMEMIELWNQKQKSWFYRDLAEKLALLWIQNGINAANRGLKGVENELLSLIKKMLAV